jgi:hypothetical protein
MIHMVVMKYLMIPFTILVGAGVRDLKIQESEWEVLCTDSTALISSIFFKYGK